jgi:hypothetical protein
MSDQLGLLSHDLEDGDSREVTLDGRRYRARITSRHGKWFALVEYHYPATGWREVRNHSSRIAVVRATGLGDWNEELRTIVYHDGRMEGEDATEGWGHA